MDGERAQQLVRPGDVATRIRDLAEVGDLVTGKALDNRVGVYVMLEGLRAARPAQVEVHATATAQEEVGLRGARIAAHRIAPDIAVAIDTCPADDGPGTPNGPGSVNQQQSPFSMQAPPASRAAPGPIPPATAAARRRALSGKRRRRRRR